MSAMENETEAVDESAILAWLIDQLTEYDQVDPDTITAEAPLEEMDLDSIYLMTICADIEDEYEVSIDPEFFTEHQNLGGVAAALAARIAAA